MVQFQTTRGLDRLAPGAMISPAQERETESAYIPWNLQTLTGTFAGTDPAVVGDYTITLPLLNGSSYTFTYTSVGDTLANTGPLVAAAWNADPVVGKLFFASSASAVVTFVAKSSNTSIAAADWTVVVPGATTLTIAQTVASGSSSLRMGVLYAATTAPAFTQAITGTPRDAVLARALLDADTVGLIRGMVGREANSTQMSPDFTNTTPDQYLSGQVFPGLLRNLGAFIVDPASAAISPTTANIYAVLPAGTGTVVGALTTISTNNLEVGAGINPLIRVIAVEETPVFQAPSQRMVRCKINRTN